MTDLVNRTELVALMDRLLRRLETDPDISASCAIGYRTAMDEVKSAIPVRQEKPATELLAARAKLEAAEKLAEALKETRAELAKHVDLNAPLRKPYEHPLSVYDRAGESLAAWEAAQ